MTVIICCRKCDLFWFIHVPRVISLSFSILNDNIVAIRIGDIFGIVICRPTFISIFKSKSVQNFKPDPYIATILNCGVWAFYGLPFVTPDNTLVISINSFGFFLEIFYTTVFFVYSPWNKRVRKKNSKAS